MSHRKYRIEGTVIAVFNIEDFEGVVIPAFVDPNFVIALRIDESRHPVRPGGSEVEVAAFDVVFYAVQSVSGLFGRSDVVGESVRLDVAIETVDGQDWHLLALA